MGNKVISSTELLILGWEFDMNLHKKGIQLEKNGFVVKRWENLIQIYRKGLPCCLMEASNYSYEEMTHLMRGLKMELE